jgi:hypothetical protein
MTTRRAGIAGLVLAAGLATALVVPALAASGTSEKLVRYKIVGPSSARAGRVTFKVANTSTIGHEMVVIRTDTKASKLSTKNGRASEKGSLGEVELEAGASRSLVLTLRPGHYVLLCNVGHHYLEGMRKDFTVS